MAELAYAYASEAYLFTEVRVQLPPRPQKKRFPAKYLSILTSSHQNDIMINMSINLVRTTTYFDPDLLNLAKKQAIDEGKSLYEVINEALRNLLNKEKASIQEITTISQYKKLIPTYKLGLKKKVIKRNDAYEL